MDRENMLENVRRINNNATASVIFRAFAHRQKISHEIILTRFKNSLLKGGNKVVDKDFMGTFKGLSEAGFGDLKHGRGANPTIFKCHVSLIDIGLAAVDPNKFTEFHTLPVKDFKRRGRPVGWRKYREAPKAEPKLSGVVLMFNDFKGHLIPIKLEDAERLAEQVRVIKESLKSAAL